MDSMRSLNTSLPTSSPKPRHRQPPEELMQAFRAAALSVTTLYKTAASDQTRARQTGYQEALDDLLVFLDHENLGLGDGEGWRVRQWATERLDGGNSAASNHGNNDSEDERTEDARRSTSPVLERKGARESPDIRERPRSESHADLSTPTASSPHPPQLPIQVPSSETFSFQSSIPYPAHSDTDMSSTHPDEPSAIPSSSATSSPSSARRVEVVTRSSRLRSGNSSSKMSTRSSPSLTTLGSGAGHKRRLPFGEFFDFGGKDVFGGGKRGRHN
ncbi:MAG: hypothetical protein M1817_002344 [Caeruleum heppii]|nr:MAG: hypothetical protein M1817_003471 [Caeruleum heppii]KAI9673706.1 MAG: hypothetical protein M1817_002344 [Caeruleum heppii]